MELLLELLLTMVLSVLIAFLLGKVVSVAASDEGDADACGIAEGVASPSSPMLDSSKVAVSGPRVVFSGDVTGEAEAIEGIREGLHAEGREVASACGDDCIETVEDRGVGETVHVEGEELAGEGLVVGGSEEVRARESVLEEADGAEERPGAAAEETEENLANVTPEKIGRVLGGLATEEGLLPAKDGGQVVNIALSLDEEKGVAKGLATGEVGAESTKDGEGLAMVETDGAKVDAYVTPKDVGLESKNKGPETSVKSEKTGSLFDEDDDWEGIERSDLEKLFGAATAFVSSAEGDEALSKLSNDLQMQLYGLHKIATEGPCYESQPLSLKVSARARWHAWQRLGSMNPEMAMEKYIALLADSIPGWMPQKHGAHSTPIEGEVDRPFNRMSTSGVVVSSSPPEDQLFQKNERNLESPYAEECDISKGTETRPSSN